MKLHYTEKALRLIANKAMNKNTGARGLRAILENLLTDAMYEVNLDFLNFWPVIIASLACNATVHVYKHSLWYIISPIQIPDAKTGKDRIDAVVVDEDSIVKPGGGVKVLRGDGALDRYLSEAKTKDETVRYTNRNQWTLIMV